MVRVVTPDDTDPEEPLFARSDRVRVRLRDGRTLEGAEIRHARGHARNPVSDQELQAKFADCVGDRLPADRRNALLQRLRTLERTAIRELCAG
jgi:2-methylcitrate dehydratase PrpD